MQSILRMQRPCRAERVACLPAQFIVQVKWFLGIGQKQANVFSDLKEIANKVICYSSVFYKKMSRSSESSNNSTVSLAEEWKHIHSQVIALRKRLKIWPSTFAQVVGMDSHDRDIMELFSQAGRDSLISTDVNSFSHMAFLAARNFISESGDGDTSFFNIHPPEDTDELLYQFNLDNKTILNDHNIYSITLIKNCLTFIVPVDCVASYGTSPNQLRNMVFLHPFVPLPGHVFSIDCQIMRSLKCARSLPLASPTNFGSGSLILLEDGDQVCISAKHVISDLREDVNLGFMATAQGDSSKYLKLRIITRNIHGKSNESIISANHDVGLVVLNPSFDSTPYMVQSLSNGDPGMTIPDWAHMSVPELQAILQPLEFTKHGCSSGLTSGHLAALR
jgi:hypothetical protein